MKKEVALKAYKENVIVYHALEQTENGLFKRSIIESTGLPFETVNSAISRLRNLGAVECNWGCYRITGKLNPKGPLHDGNVVTPEELAEATGLGVKTVLLYLRSFKKRGLVERVYHAATGIPGYVTTLSLQKQPEFN